MKLFGVGRRFGGISLCALSVLVYAQLATASSPPSAEEKLTGFDFFLVGLSLRPDPEVQTVPRNTATGLRLALELPGASVDSLTLASLLPDDLVVRAELVGPGIDVPIQLTGAPGELLAIPAREARGLYLVRDIRLEDANGVPFLRAVPDNATVEVIDRVLITEVKTRPLTLEEIRQKGILFGEDSFTGFNFTLALNLDSRPVTVDLPVLFDSNDVPIPLGLNPSIDLEGQGPPLFNTGITPVMMTPDFPTLDQDIIAQIPSDLRIPGLLVIPGDVGFLNQFFSALLIVSNGAPDGSGLSVHTIQGTIELPPGDDQVPDTADDPLRLAETLNDPNSRNPVKPLHTLGPDGIPGTADDGGTIAPAEQAQAEFLLEGRLEGFHDVNFQIDATLDGLPVGPIPIKGVAKGGVLVRNADFQLTFSAPSIVRAQEEFDLFVTVTNTSQTNATLVRLSLASGLSGAVLAPGEDPIKQLEDLGAGDSEVLGFRFVAQTTGQVNASYLRVEQGSGNLVFRLGVGERGVPLSPDTIVLPQSVQGLRTDSERTNQVPSRVVQAALRVLGQAWSIATAPSGALPDDVLRIPRGIVLEKAEMLAETGFRVQLGESLEESLVELAMEWIDTDDPGFDQLLRETDAGRGFLAAVGTSLQEISTIAPTSDFVERLAQRFTGRTDFVLVASGEPQQGTPFSLTLTESMGGGLGHGVSSSLAQAGAVSYPVNEAGLLLVPTLSSARYRLDLDGTSAGSGGFSLILPRTDGALGVFHFPDLVVEPDISGFLDIDLPVGATTLELTLLRNGAVDRTESSLPVLPVSGEGPNLVAATVIGPETLSGADPWGRVLALSFDRELRPREAEQTVNYDVEANEVLSAVRQLSGRLVFLFLRDPVGPLVTRSVEVSALFDTRGRPMNPLSQSAVIGSRITESAGLVSGRVLDAEGRGISQAEVLLINQRGNAAVGISSKNVELDGRYQFDFVLQSPDGPFSIRAFDPQTGTTQQLSTRVREQGEHIVVDLVLRGRGGVQGFVRDGDGLAQPGARVLVTSQADAASFAFAEANGEGFYQATGIAVGPYAVKAVLGATSGTASGNLQRAGTFATTDVSLNIGRGSVSGQVFERDGVEKDPLLGVRVFYTIPDGARILTLATVDTDITGSYRFEDIPSGDFTIFAQDPIRGRVDTQSGFLPLGADLSGIDLFFDEQKLGSISGIVRTASGPQENAVVRAAGRLVVTDANGVFSMGGLPMGPLTVSAELPGTSRRASLSATITAGQDTALNLLLSGAGNVVVDVVDSDGPVDGVDVFRVVGGPCQGEVLRTVNGQVTFTDVTVPGGEFKASANGDIAVGRATIRAEGGSDAITLFLKGFGSLSGVVEDANGPVFGADVVLSSLRFDTGFCAYIPDSRAQQVRTNSAGQFSFDRIPVGAWTVSATAAGGVSKVASEAGVFLQNGDSVDDLSLFLTDQVGQIVGTVFLPDGETPAGAGVTVSTSSPTGADITVVTDASGAYEFAKILPPGRYTLTVSDPVTRGVNRETVFLQQDQVLEANLRLLARGKVQATVLDGRGDPVSDGFVSLKGAAFPFDEAAAALTPSDNGVVVFERISEGSFTVTASANGLGGRAQGMVVEQDATTEVTVSLTAVGNVIGVVRTPDGNLAVPNAEVRLNQAGAGKLLGSIASGSSLSLMGACAGDFGNEALGAFFFEDVPVGSYLLSVTDPVTGRTGELSTTIAAQDETACVELRLQGLGTLAGSVTRNGASVGAADIRVTVTNGVSQTVRFTATATTDGNGGFIFEGVPVGNYELRATVPGQLLTGILSGSITEDGERLEGLEVPLEDSGSIAGLVLGADGSTAIPGAELTLSSAKGTLRGTSSGNGSFLFDFVPAGPFTLRAEEGTGEDAGEQTGDLNAGQALENFEVRLNGLGEVTGTARDENGVALTSGIVRLSTPPPFRRSTSTTVDVNGRFRFLSIPVGMVQVDLELVGSPLRGHAEGTILQDGDVLDLNVDLEPARPIVGHVELENGIGPAANASVSVQGIGYTISGITDAQGDFRLEGIPFGNFVLDVTHSLTGGRARTSGTIDDQTPLTGLDVGTLTLDASPIAVDNVTPENQQPAAPDFPLVVNFTDSIEPITLNFTVQGDGQNLSVSRALSNNNRTVTFFRGSHWPPRASITLTINPSLRDTFGRNLAEPFVYTWTTKGAVAAGVVSTAGALTDVSVQAIANSQIIPATSFDTQTGEYRIEDLPLGPVTVEATDTNLGLSDSRLIDVLPDDARKEVDLNLMTGGTVAGLVSDALQQPVAAGLSVRVTSGVTPIRLVETGGDGRYSAGGIPFGDVTVDVFDGNTGDRGQEQVTLTELNSPLTDVNVELLGVGSVFVVVEDANGVPVLDPNLTLSYDRFGETFVSMTPIPQNGGFLFGTVLAGAIDVDAESNGLQGSVADIVSPGSQTDVLIRLEQAGTLSGRVVAFGASQNFEGADVRLFDRRGLARGSVVTDAVGFSFGNLTVGDGPYRLDVDVNGQLRARRSGLLVPPDLNLEIEMVGFGEVDGVLVPDTGESLSDNITVTLRSTSSIGGTFRAQAIGAAYSFIDIPTGPFTVEAFDNTNRLGGETSGSVSADGQTVTLDDIVMERRDLDLRFGKTLVDANGADYVLQKDGRLTTGLDSIFNASSGSGMTLDVRVGAGSPIRFDGLDAGSQEQSGREIVTGSVTIDGIRVQRKIFVPEGAYFARYLDIYENLSAEIPDIVATVTTDINNSATSPSIVQLASGAGSLTTPESWLVVDDEANADPYATGVNSIPATAFVLGDPLALPSDIRFEPVGNEARLSVDYQIPAIMPGQRYVVMYFVSQQLNRNASQLAAERLVNLAPEAIEGLSSDEVGAMINFDVPPNLSSALEPLPRVSGFVSGRLFAADGLTPIEDDFPVQTLEFQSREPLFGRVHPIGARTNGNFGIDANLGASVRTQVVAVPLAPYTIRASSKLGSRDATERVVDGEFGSPITQTVNLARSNDVLLDVSTENPNDRAGELVDGSRSASSYWQSAFDDTVNRGGQPFIQVELPSAARVERLFLDTRSIGNNGTIEEVRLEFLDNLGNDVVAPLVREVLAPDYDVEVGFGQPLDGVRTVRVVPTRDIGRSTNVHELEIYGVPLAPSGISVTDIVFTDTHTLRLQTETFDAIPLESRLVLQGTGFVQVLNSDPNGNYVVAPLPTDIGIVQVVANDVNNLALTTTESFDVTALGPDVSRTIRYPVTTSVSGRVLDNGIPVEGRQVTLFVNGVNRADFTARVGDPEPPGTYRFDGVVSGTHALQYNHTNNRQWRRDDLLVDAPTALVEDILVPRFGAIDVQVFIAASPVPVPATGGQVFIDDVLGTQGRNLANGTASFNAVGEGSIVIRVRRPGSVLESTFQRSADPDLPQPQLLPVTIPALGSVSGIVSRASAAALAGSTVRISNNLGESLETVSSFSGAYQFADVRALEPFTVEAFFPGSDRIFATETGTLAGDGAVLQNLNLTLPAVAPVTVQVETSGGVPIAGADVSIRDSFSGGLFLPIGTTNGSGTIVAPTIPGPDFTVSASLGGNEIGQNGGVVSVDGQGVAVTLIADVLVDVSGSVFAADGLTPVIGANLELLRQGDQTSLGTTTTDVDGAYRFDAVELAQGDTAELNVEWNGFTGSETALVSQIGAPLFIDVTTDAPVLKGRVLESGGASSVPDVLLDLRVEGTFDAQTTISGVDGDYAFVGVSDGAYELIAEDNAELFARKPILIAPNDTVTIQDIELPAFGTVEVLVEDENGSPLTSRPVFLRSANLFAARQTSADVNGVYRFERVAVGSFSVFYDHQVNFVPVPASGTDRVANGGELVARTIRVPAIGGVLGQFLDQNGLPVEGFEGGPAIFVEGRRLETSDGIYTDVRGSDFDATYQIATPNEEMTLSGIAETLAEPQGAINSVTVSQVDEPVGLVLGTGLPMPLNVTLNGAGGGEIDGDGVVVFNASSAVLPISLTNDKEYPFLQMIPSGTTVFDYGPIKTNGVLHSRSVHVHSSGNFVRYLEVFENPNAFDADVAVALDAENFFPLETSSGDASVTLDDRYALDAQGLGWVFSGDGAVATRQTAARLDGQRLELDVRPLTIPAGERLVVMHFVVTTIDINQARTLANELRTPDPGDDALEGLNTAEIDTLRSQIVNFVIGGQQ